MNNRVSEIRKLTQTDNWYHVASKENPADMISRGVSAVRTMAPSSIWLEHDNTITEGSETKFTFEENVAPESVFTSQLETHSGTPRGLICLDGADGTRQCVLSLGCFGSSTMNDAYQEA